MDLHALLAHARALVGVELGALADALGLPVPVGLVGTKGWSGQLIEQELGVAVGGVGDELRARQAGARVVRGAGGPARRALGRRPAGRGRDALGAGGPGGGRAARRLRAVRTRIFPPWPRRRDHRPRDSADLRDAYDPEGRPTRIGKSGFYLRPAFVARILSRARDM
jgi:hypothetical protein